MSIYPITYKSRILQVFGDKALNSGLFYLYPESLRIELSGSQPYIRMFLRAYDRAKAVINFVLGDRLETNICLSFYGDKSLIGNLSVFRNLRSCGIKIPKTVEIWQHQQQNEDEENLTLTRTFMCFDIKITEIDLFLWGLFANELGISPRNSCCLHLFDFDLQILFHPYDDRGMDIIGNKSLTKQIYEKFNDWLLDYDRTVMDNYFN
jgi:Domain of unknown function (DUF3885)